MALKHDWTITDEDSKIRYQSLAKSEDIAYLAKQILEDSLSEEDLYGLTFAKFFIDYEVPNGTVGRPGLPFYFYEVYRAIDILIKNNELDKGIPWLKECIKCRIKIGYLPDIKNVITPRSYREFRYQHAVERDFGSQEYQNYLKSLIDLTDEDYLRHVLKNGVSL